VNRGLRFDDGSTQRQSAEADADANLVKIRRLMRGPDISGSAHPCWKRRNSRCNRREQGKSVETNP